MEKKKKKKKKQKQNKNQALNKQGKHKRRAFQLGFLCYYQSQTAGPRDEKQLGEAFLFPPTPLPKKDL